MKKKDEDRHHICPLSRGGRKKKNNIVIVDKHRHALFHILFQNQTPEEVVKTLNEEFFGGKYEIKMRRRK